MHQINGNAVALPGTDEKLKAALCGCFDLWEDHELFGMTFTLYGRHIRRTARYFASKKVEVYAYRNVEHLFYSKLDEPVSDVLLGRLKQYTEVNSKALVAPDNEHMSSIMTFILESASIEKTAEESVRKFKYRKNFLFSLHGWVDVKLIVLVEGGSRVLENGLAKGDAQRLQILNS